MGMIRADSKEEGGLDGDARMPARAGGLAAGTKHLCEASRSGQMSRRWQIVRTHEADAGLGGTEGERPCQRAGVRAWRLGTVGEAGMGSREEKAQWPSGGRTLLRPRRQSVRPRRFVTGA